ncbi:MAG: endonuclease/exonuclease/phosphatase family protein [Sphingomicrobium sp.]
MGRRKWGRWALIGLATLLVVLSFLPAWQTDRWWVRQWDYPRLQVASLLVVILLLLFWVDPKRRRGYWALFIGCAAAMAWQVSHFLAYLPLYPREVASVDSCPVGQRLSLLNANVLMTNDDYSAVLAMAVARKPDVLLLLETGTEWKAAMAPLKRDYPYHLSEAVPNTYGMMLFSRLPMSGSITNLIQPGVPSAKVEIALPGGERILLNALHPEPPWPGDDSGERDAELVMVGREVRDSGRASIVMGDLNDVAWSQTSQLFKDVSGMGDPRIGRGFYPTFNAKYPLLRWPLDHLFVSPHFRISRIDVLESIGSDHFPIYFDLCLVAPAGKRLVKPSASGETETEASSEIREGKQEAAEENRGQ